VPETPLDRGLDAYARRAWAEAHAELARADAHSPLGPDALEQFAMAAYLIGHDVESEELLSRAHHAFLALGEPVKAARCAVWITFGLFSRGDRARAAGWAARAHRLIEEEHLDSPEHGYLVVQSALKAVGEGDIDAARQRFTEAAAIGDRFGDQDLVNLARQGQGRALVRLGRVAEGVALLDEVMVAVTEGELSPIVTGTIYCSVVDACFELFDLRRAHEWTEALDGWCASQPDIVPYRGSCRVHRAEIMALRGRWDEAMREAEYASGGPGAAQTLGAAWYQRGELHRVRGEIAAAEEAYRAASEAGRSPQPGLALLRLGQGRVDAAIAAIDRVTDNARERRPRAALLAARIEIRLAAGDRSGARRDADALSTLAGELPSPFLAALARRAEGAVALEEGAAETALHSLETSRDVWRELDAPYETARTQVLIGRACRALGDRDTARMELESACRAFTLLGAVADLAATERVGRSLVADQTGALTSREVQVLRLVAAGKTNKAIADELGISEKTVARHLSNIFVKLDLSSRAAATAYAFQHQLL
jgi:DNA-binding CsgD family transcriptional regulator